MNDIQPVLNFSNRSRPRAHKRIRSRWTMHALHSAANQAAARRISLAAWFLVAVLAIASPIRVASEEAADPDKPVQKCTGIGIDLGTTFSAVAILQQDSMEVINNKHGNSITPSIVAFEEDGSVLVGEQADNLLSTLPERTIYAVKRIIGRPIDDPVVQVIFLWPIWSEA